jgi:hypothetical protein
MTLTIISNSFFNVTVHGDDYRELSTKLNDEIQELAPGDREVEIESFEIDKVHVSYGKYRGLARVKLL